MSKLDDSSMVEFSRQQNGQQNPGKGILLIKVISGHFTRDTDRFTAMDPYCMIKCSNGQNFRTKTKKSEGQHPVWEETFNISVTSMGDEIFLQCFDDDVFGSDLIGETTFPIYKLCVPDGKT